MSRTILRTLTLLAFCALLSPDSRASAQGATTSGLTGIVKDPQDAVVPGVTVTAVHQPSATTYEAVTQTDGRYFIPGMRVGGPYTVTAMLTGFQTQIQNDITLNLGVVQDVSFKLTLATISEDVIVIGATSPVFASTRTGAATSVSRNDLATLPTVSGRINDIARLAPQYGGSGTFAGQDNRMNNITVDGSYFNNSFGLGGQPGDRTGVAPISLEAVEQVQVSVAPYDVRQGNFVGAGVNMVTRSGANKPSGSVYTRYRNQSFVGTEAAGQPYNPGIFTTKDTGAFLGGPILKNRLFAFGSFEKQSDVRPLTTFRANQGGEPTVGSVTRVLASDLNQLSSFMSAKFKYDTGPYENIPKTTPAKPFLVKFDYNMGKSNKINFRYSRLDSDTDVQLSNSNSAGNTNGRSSAAFSNTSWLGFQASNYTILENIRSGIGEWNSVLGSSMSNSLTLGYTTNDESRGPQQVFPFIDILDGAGTTYTSLGGDPFTPNNELRYHTFQGQDSFTKFGARHSMTFGVSLEKYRSENVFFPTRDSAYAYNSLSDFYADMNDYVANPGRTTSPITLARFQIQYLNLPGLTKPLQPLEAWYIGEYAQDQWHARSNMTVTAGIRVDTAFFKNTAYDNPNVDNLTFRDENGNATYNSGKMPNATPLWSPRVGFNWDVSNDQSTQVRGGTGVFTGKPAYVWISNQIGNTGMLLGAIDDRATNLRPFNPDPKTYAPKTPPTGTPAASLTLNVTDPNFKFPQTWRSNIAVDRLLPWGLVGTGEYLYNRDINGIYYINANLPLAQSSFVGVDNRPRWTGTSCNAPTPGPCVSRINNAAGNQLTAAYVIKNQDVGRSWNVSGSLMKSLAKGFAARAGYSYGISRNTVDAGSTASGTFGSNYQHGDPNITPLSLSSNSAGHRVYASATYTRNFIKVGATTISAFWDIHPNGQTSYIFAGDMNGDTASNDAVYIARDRSEMNFTPFTPTTGNGAGHLYTADEQAAAWDAYIAQDPYLSKHRGQYAERNGVFLPMVNRMDFSVSQDIFRTLSGRKHAGQIRLDVTNFGNLLNSNWGAGKRVIQNAILTTPTADANGKSAYRLALIGPASNNYLPATSFQTNAGNVDVYTLMLSFRYNFN